MGAKTASVAKANFGIGSKDEPIQPLNNTQKATIEKDTNWITDWYNNRTNILDDKNDYLNIPKIDLSKIPKINIDNLSEGTVGEYNPNINEISLVPNFDDLMYGATTHEFNHAYQNEMNREAFSKYVENPVLENMGLRNEEKGFNGTKFEKYINSPDEIHSRLMQYRQKNDFKPNQIIDKETIKNSSNRNEFKLEMFNDDEIINLLNKTVDNNNYSSDFNYG